MQFALLGYYLAFFAIAFVWPTWRLWRAERINALVLPFHDSAYGVVSKGFRLLILGLFTLRYAVNVSQALHPELRAAAEFITPVALGYGAISGLLLGRVLWQLRRAPRGAA